MSWLLLSALEVYTEKTTSSSILHVPVTDLDVNMFEETYTAEFIDDQLNTIYMQKDEFVIVLIEDQ